MAVADAVADAEAGHTENEAQRHNEQAPVPRQKFALNATIRTHSRTTGRATSHCARHESPLARAPDYSGSKLFRDPQIGLF